MGGVDGNVEDKAGEQMKYAFSKDVEISFELTDSKPKKMLLVHGLGASKKSWSEVTPMLEKDFELILIDLKGFGESSKPFDGKYSPTDHAEILTKFIIDQDLNDFVLVGHSLGGLVALLACLNVESRVSKLVLLDAPLFPDSLPPFLEMLQNPLALSFFLATYPPASRGRLVVSNLFYDSKTLSEKIKARYEWFLSTQDAIDVLVQSVKSFSVPTTEIKKAGKLKISCLVIWGENDSVIPMREEKKIQGLISNSVLKTIPDCGHVPQEEKPAETAEAILEFVKKN